MPQEQLQRALTELHEQLGTAETLSDQDRAALVGALKEIQEALERTSDVPASPESGDAGLRDRLYGLVEELESAHPKLAEVLHNVSESLANLGI